MKQNIKEKVLKDIDTEAKEELKKWISEGGNMDEYVSEKYGSHLMKVIDLTLAEVGKVIDWYDNDLQEHIDRATSNEAILIMEKSQLLLKELKEALGIK